MLGRFAVPSFYLCFTLFSPPCISPFFVLYYRSKEVSMNATPETLTVNHRTFAVKKLLGRGKSGYSYLVEQEGKRYVLKQIHHEPCDYYTFGDKLGAELYAYEILTGCQVPMPRLLEADRAQERLLKEYIPGSTALELVMEGRMTPALIDQIQELCTTLYAHNLNIDYFPTNFVLHHGILYYVDYECNQYMEQWDFAHWGIQYWSMTPALQAYLEKK